MLIFITLLAFIYQAINGHASTCNLNRQIQKIGCFHNSNHDMVVLEEKKVDWNNFEAWFDKMTCRCVSKARQRGYDYIQISDFGECSGGRNFDSAIVHRKMNPSVECVNFVSWGMCSDESNHKCIGTDNTGYIYKITGHAPSRNGGYSNWNGWSHCSVTCGDGVQERVRECTNPIPQGHGKDCSHLGSSRETKSCNSGRTCAGAFITEVSFTSRNYPTYKLGEGGRHGSWIMTNSKQDFRLVGALNGREGAVSIQTVDGRRYLRHAGWIGYFHTNDGSKLFKDDASFYVRKNRFFPGTISLESCNYPGAFLRHAHYRINLHRPDGSELFKNDASFIMATTEDKYTGFANLVSRNYPHYSIGENQQHEGFIIVGKHKFRMVKGLNGKEGTISFQTVHGNRYLRHRHGLVHFDVYDPSVIKHLQLFKDDASFHIIENKYFNGYAAFESSNYRGAFLRHQGYRLKLHYPDATHSELYKNDVSFMISRVSAITQVSFTSRNYPRYKLGEGGHHGSWIITNSRQDFRLVGALNGRAGAVSIQTLDGRRYLRHAGWVGYFHTNDGSKLFKDDASFYIRKNRFFPGTISLESCNYPGTFLRHAHYRINLHRPDGSELFKNDASFIMATTEA